MAVTYNSYFNKLPKIDYDINRSLIDSKYENVTNIFFRIRYMHDILHNASSYYVVEIDDGDTPEILAEKIYGDAGAGWMITLANQMVDPQFEWPMDYKTFENYIKDKYGSIEVSQTTWHHYEKVVRRTINNGPPVEFRYVVNQKKLTKNDPGAPHEYYETYIRPGLWRYPEIDYSADTTKYTSDINGVPLADAEQKKYRADETLFTLDQPELTADLILGREGNAIANGALSRGESVITYEFDGDTIEESVSGEAINNYDYELELNEKRRLIKVIKKEYYAQILGEFDTLTGFRPSFLRTVR